MGADKGCGARVLFWGLGVVLPSESVCYSQRKANFAETG